MTKTTSFQGVIAEFYEQHAPINRKKLNHFLLESGTHFQGRSPDNEAMRSSRS
jgi:hypothetical protein